MIRRYLGSLLKRGRKNMLGPDRGNETTYWQPVLESLPCHSFFQTPRWLGVIERTYGLAPHSFSRQLPDGTAVHLPLHATGTDGAGRGTLFSLFDGTYGGFLSPRPISHEVQLSILAEVFSNPCIRTVMIYPHPLWGQPLPEEFLSGSHEVQILFLKDDFEKVWTEDFTAKVRNQTRKAEKSGLLVVEDRERTHLDAFYDLYSTAHDGWEAAGTPYPRALFHCIGDLPSDEARFYLAFAGGALAAGILVFWGKGEAFYWLGAYNKAHAAACPNNLLLARAIRDACGEGQAIFNMGSSGKLTGVHKYKESFGARLIEYHSFRVTRESLEQVH